VAAVHNFDHGPAFFLFVGRALFGIGYAMLGGAIARFALGPQKLDVSMLDYPCCNMGRS
jgi:hypothetical protein